MASGGCPPISRWNGNDSGSIHFTHAKFRCTEFLLEFCGATVRKNVFECVTAWAILTNVPLALFSFVQELDDVAFAVASMGLFSRKIQEECLGMGK